MIVYVREWDKLREIETFGEFDFGNGDTGYVIKLWGQAQLFPKRLTYKNIKEAKEQYLKDLKTGADKNMELYNKYKDADMEIIKIPEPEEKVLTEATK